VGIFSGKKKKIYVYIIFYLFTSFLVPVLMAMSLDGPVIKVTRLRFDDQDSVCYWEGPHVSSRCQEPFPQQ
jgi:hypothetical protein